MVPVAVVARAPVVFFTVALRLTDVPVTWGLVGVADRTVTDVAAGGGGSGSVPWRFRVSTLPELPANFEFSVPAASPHVVDLKFGMVKFDWVRVTLPVPELYGDDDDRTTLTGDE